MTAEREPHSTLRELSTRVAVQVATFFEPPSRLTIDRLRGPRTDVDAVGRRGSSNETTLDLIVSDQGPGLEVAQHVQAAVQACQ